MKFEIIKRKCDKSKKLRVFIKSYYFDFANKVYKELVIESDKDTKTIKKEVFDEMIDYFRDYLLYHLLSKIKDKVIECFKNFNKNIIEIKAYEDDEKTVYLKITTEDNKKYKVVIARYFSSYYSSSSMGERGYEVKFSFEKDDFEEIESDEQEELSVEDKIEIYEKYNKIKTEILEKIKRGEISVVKIITNDYIKILIDGEEVFSEKSIEEVENDLEDFEEELSEIERDLIEKAVKKYFNEDVVEIHEFEDRFIIYTSENDYVLDVKKYYRNAYDDVVEIFYFNFEESDFERR